MVVEVGNFYDKWWTIVMRIRLSSCWYDHSLRWLIWSLTLLRRNVDHWRKLLLFYFFQIIIESDTDSPILPRHQQEPDWVSQIENIPSQNGYHRNGYLSVHHIDHELHKHTPEFLEDVCFDFERTLERSKTKQRPEPPPLPPRNLRHIFGSAMVDASSYHLSGESLSYFFSGWWSY